MWYYITYLGDMERKREVDLSTKGLAPYLNEQYGHLLGQDADARQASAFGEGIASI